MSGSTPPIETQRFGRSQTPESPRPVHAPLPSSIPVLNNQMDPVFNDTATYNIPSNQTFSPYSESHRNFPESSAEEHDAVQSFFRGAEAETFLPQDMTKTQETEEPNPTVAHFNQPISVPDPAEQFEPTISTSAPQLTPTQTSPLVDTHNFVTNEKKEEKEESQQGNDDNFPSNSSSRDLPPESSTLQDTTKDGGSVDYQSLLETITQSASTAPPADAFTAPTTAIYEPEQNANPLTSIPGLPPKPPAQELSPEVSGITQSFGNESLPNTNSITKQQLWTDHVSSATEDMTHAGQAALDVRANGIGSASILYQTPTEMSYAAPIDTAFANANQDLGALGVPGERPWSPKTQADYDQFLEDERRYVTEGIWDKFPNGSRLFVGNLPSEKVTKRDLFHFFHKHGRLAQISIKQAYGFVQFLEASSCHAALEAEQGVEIRGRKVHLEVSKPQKNTRGSGAGNSGSGSNKAAARRRSRSPERIRSNNDRFGARPSFSDYRDEHGRRRAVRSPSPPRTYRSRDDYRVTAQSPRVYQFQDPRPRSPAVPAFPPPFTPQGYDEDAALQLPRRDSRDVPDVQILILDPSVTPSFINWVEQAFRSKGLRASTIWLNQRLPMQAVVKRQIIEGVQAIVKLIQHNQFTQKVPLQVFDRSAGASNVNFNEYVDLDVSVAADIVLHARNKERSQVHQSPQAQYSPAQAYHPSSPYSHHLAHQSPQQLLPPGPPQYHPSRPPQPPAPFPYPHQQPPQPLQHPQHPQHTPHPTPLTPTANAPNLQQLLANLKQPQEPPPPPSNPPSAHGPRPDIGGLLSNITAHQQNQTQPYNQQAPRPVPQGYGGQPGSQNVGAGQQSNVQNIMEQLARYQR